MMTIKNWGGECDHMPSRDLLGISEYPFSSDFFLQGVGVHVCLPLCFEADNLHGFAGSQLERNFCLRMNHTSNLTHAWFRWYLNGIVYLELILAQMKALGLFRGGYISFSYKKDVGFDNSGNKVLWVVLCVFPLPTNPCHKIKWFEVKF